MDEFLDSAPCGFLSFADDGTLLRVNNTLSQWLGYEPDELAGRPVESIFSIGGRIFYQTHFFPLLKLKGQAEEIYFSLKTKGGGSLPVLTSAVRRERGGAFVSDCVFLPMHQRQEYEDELLQAKKVAEEASTAKAKFLSMMSHELRTPMNAILGFGQLLEMDDLAPSQSESVQYILNAGQHLLSLINEILDISRIDAGRLDVSRELVPVNDVMQEAFEMARPLAAKAGIQMAMQPFSNSGSLDYREPPTQYSVWADRGRLRQVLLNLIANAIKYNRPDGTVTVECERGADDTSDGEQRLRFVVLDTGAGIAPDDRDKLFVPFERLGAEGTEIEGTGLGLALCKRLTEAMGGQIGVESTVGEGSCFWVELPRVVSMLEPGAGSTSNDVQINGQAAPSTASLVLYVEDNPSNLMLVQHILSRRPAIRLIHAATGQAGVQLARAHLPNLILLDLHLPDLMGDVVLEHLLEDERTRGIPIVLLSADATPTQMERLVKAGARDYLTKPFDVHRLLQILDSQIQDSKA